MGRCEGLVGWSTPSNTSPPGCNLQQTLYSCSFYRHTCTILKPNQKHAHAFFLFIYSSTMQPLPVVTFITIVVIY